MKRLLVITLFMTFSAQATITDCQLDAESYGSHNMAVSPAAECEGLLSAETDKKDYTSSDGLISVEAYGNMAYVTVSGVTSLLAGNQTMLNGVSKISINETARKLLIYKDDQSNSCIATYDIDHIGNVAPLQVSLSEDFADASNIVLLDTTNQIGVISQTNKSINFIKSDADERYQGAKYSKSIQRSIAGASTQLLAPIVVAESVIRSEIYVLDSDQILVYSNNPQGDEAPIRTIAATGRGATTLMKLDANEDNLLFYTDSTALTSLSLD